MSLTHVSWANTIWSKDLSSLSVPPCCCHVISVCVSFRLGWPFHWTALVEGCFSWGPNTTERTFRAKITIPYLPDHFQSSDVNMPRQTSLCLLFHLLFKASISRCWWCADTILYPDCRLFAWMWKRVSDLWWSCSWTKYIFSVTISKLVKFALWWNETDHPKYKFNIFCNRKQQHHSIYDKSRFTFNTCWMQKKQQHPPTAWGNLTGLCAAAGRQRRDVQML